MTHLESAAELLAGRQYVTAEMIADAERYLAMLGSLRQDVWSNGWTIVPRPTGDWRSTAADRYADRLGELQSLVISSRDMIDRAEESLDRSIARMRAQLDEQIARLAR